MESMMIYVPIVLALIGLLFMAMKRAWVLKQDAGDGKMKEISDYIYEGALAFLKAEYRLLAVFVILSSVVLAGITFIPGVKTHLLIIVAFIFGAIFSALAGNMGMKIATKTNVRTTQAARTSLPQALKVSFGGGTVMGLGVAGLAVLGLTAFFIIFLLVKSPSLKILPSFDPAVLLSADFCRPASGDAMASCSLAMPIPRSGL
jgi:K(+)-stimulated pyrophosphate-energized sodium pump